MKRRWDWMAWTGLLAGLAMMTGTAWAQQQPQPETAVPVTNSGDTVWMLVSTALVMLMTPGLAFFYGGLVRRKNVLSILMQCFAVMCIVSIQWVAFGYSLAFGEDRAGLIGALDLAWLRGVGAPPHPGYAPTVPHSVFMMFQGMFAVITPCLIIGALAERMRFSAFCVFALAWATFVYDPVAHWVWGEGGFLRKMGALDFAGGAVVHVNAGIASLVASVMLGRRLRYPAGMSPPHNLPTAVLGAALLWFGWFGFNAGSALGANSVAVGAFVATHIAAASAGFAWAALDWLFNRKPTTLGMITGAVAGLVAITPACGFIKPVNGIWIGAIASILCYWVVTVLKPRFGYDDSLDAFGVHGVGGIWGSLATGIWADASVNSAGADGLLRGNPSLLTVQLETVLITAVFAGVATFVILKTVDALMGLRVREDDERIGLDLTQHREAAYTLLD